VVALVDRKPYVFDPETSELTANATADLPPVNGRCLTIPQGRGDGRVYVASAKYVLAIDPLSGKADAVGEAPEKIEQLAVSPRGAIYVSCGAKVYRLRGP
jgi:streptogramin lyase